MELEGRFIRLLERYSPDEFTSLLDSLHEFVTRNEIADGYRLEDYQAVLYFMDNDRQIYNEIMNCYNEKGIRIIDDMLKREAREQGWEATIEVNTSNIQLLWQAIHNERQRIQQEIKLYEREGITEEESDIDQLKDDHNELLKMEKSLEDILVG